MAELANQYMLETGKLTPRGHDTAVLGMAIFKHAVHVTAKEKGWWTSGSRNFGEALSLIHSEISEALEAYRDGDDIKDIGYEYPDTYDLKNGLDEVVAVSTDGEPKPVGVASELADVIIRIFDLAEGLGIPVVDALMEKHTYNLSRPHRHGGKRA